MELQQGQYRVVYRFRRLRWHIWLYECQMCAGVVRKRGFAAHREWHNSVLMTPASASRYGT